LQRGGSRRIERREGKVKVEVERVPAGRAGLLKRGGSRRIERREGKVKVEECRSNRIHE
jgi:hypothetical protein